MVDATIVNNPWFAIGTSLVSGAFAVVISTVYYCKFERRKTKIDCLRRLLGGRYVLTDGKHSDGAYETFYTALNEAVITFSDSPHVITAPKSLLADIREKRNDLFGDNIITLLRAMADDLHIDRKTLNDSFFLTPFKPDS